MTVVPGVGRGTVHLLCDSCGETCVVPDAALRDAEVVWPLMVQQGWSGSPFAVGPHQCPACASAEVVGPRRAGPPSRAVQEARTACRPRVHYRANAAVVIVGGDVDVRVADAVRDVLAQAVAARRNVVIDMTATRVIDAAGLGVLVRAQRDAKHERGALCLVRPPRFVITVLHTMRIEVLFPIFDDVDRALAWLADPECPQRPTSCGD